MEEKGRPKLWLQKPSLKGLQKAKRVLGVVLVMCFMFFFLLLFSGIFGMNKNIPWALVWMLVSFASVTGCRIDEPRPHFIVPEYDIYEF